MVVTDGKDEFHFPDFLVIVGLKRVEYGERIMPGGPSVDAEGDARRNGAIPGRKP